MTACTCKMHSVVVITSTLHTGIAVLGPLTTISVYKIEGRRFKSRCVYVFVK